MTRGAARITPPATPEAIPASVSLPALDLSAAYGRVVGGIPPVQLQALAVLDAGDMRMRELAGRLGLAKSTVTRLVDRLEAAGLAEGRSERPDRRSVLVGLSRPAVTVSRGSAGGCARSCVSSSPGSLRTSRASCCGF